MVEPDDLTGFFSNFNDSMISTIKQNRAKAFISNEKASLT